MLFLDVPKKPIITVAIRAPGDPNSLTLDNFQNGPIGGLEFGAKAVRVVCGEDESQD